MDLGSLVFSSLSIVGGSLVLFIGGSYIVYKIKKK